MPRLHPRTAGKTLQVALGLAFLALFLGSMAVVVRGELRKRREPAAPAGRVPKPPAKPPPSTPESRDAAAWIDLEARIETLRERLDYGTADREVAWFRAETPACRERAQKLRAELRSAGRAAFDRILANARSLAAEQKFTEAVAALEQVRDLHVEEYTAEVKPEAVLWGQEAHKQARRGDLPRLGRMLAELEVLLRARRLKEASELVAKERRACASLAQELDWLNGTVIEAHHVFGAVASGARAGEGKEILTAEGAGTVEKARDEEVQVRLADGRSVAVRYEDLPPDTFLRLALAGGIDDDYVAQYFLFTGRIEDARRAWARSPIREQYEAIAEQAAEAKRLAGILK